MNFWTGLLVGWLLGIIMGASGLATQLYLIWSWVRGRF